MLAVMVVWALVLLLVLIRTSYCCLEGPPRWQIFLLADDADADADFCFTLGEKRKDDVSRKVRQDRR